jgi:hypothetical protein
MTNTTFTVSTEGGALPGWWLGRGCGNASHAKDFASRASPSFDAALNEAFSARPGVRSLPAEARSATLIVLLQMLGVWATAWAALASVSSWMR